MTDKPNPIKLVDALGLKCPEPLMLLHKALNEVAGGELVEIRGDDPASARDIRKLCHFLKHHILFEQEISPMFIMRIKKKTRVL